MQPSRCLSAGLAVLLALGCAAVEPGGAPSAGRRGPAPTKRLSDVVKLPVVASPLEPAIPGDLVGGSPGPGLLASPAPSATPAAVATSVVATPAATAIAEVVPASPTATPSVPAPPPLGLTTPTPAPLPALGAGLQQLVEARLGVIARLSFQQGQANLITNNSASLIGNNGGQLITDRAGGLLGNNAAGYRLAQAAPTIGTTPGPDEVLKLRRIWDAGGSRLGFGRVGDTQGDYDRRVEVDAEGRAGVQTIATVESRHASNQKVAVIRHERLDLAADGTLRLDRSSRQAEDETGLVERITFGPTPTRIRMPEVGVDLDIERFELDLPTASGAFSYRYNKTGSTEVGTLAKVARDANGKLWYSYGDPLGYYAGTSEVRDASGTLVVRKTRELENGAVIRTYDMGDGLVMRLVRGTNNVFRGPLRAGDVEVATVALGIFSDGTTIFDLAYVDAPDQPRRVGWGVPPQTTAPSPTPRPAWRVETLAGGAAGMADGSGAVARFKSLRMLVASRQVAGRYFACDLGNHRVIRIDRGVGGWSFTTLAGNGTAGDADGAGPDARFRSPLGLAVGPDDTLYVSELEGHRIRRIREANTAPVIDTLAGAPNPGRLDGNGSAARFNGPCGLALVGDRLYVADRENHALRAIDLASPAFTVSTLVGDGTAGDADGPAAGARLRQPVALAQAADGSIWLSEMNAGRVRRYDAVGGQVETVVPGVPEASGWLDGPAGSCGLFRPVGLFPDGARGTFVTHVDIRAIATDRSVRTIAGQGIQQGGDDGPYDAATFTAVWGLVRMGDGSYLLTDSSRIRRLVPPAP
ncbi:MAG: hypothetical protein VKS61_03315 [Candidatus Sericytochromatia bacterium]|nr:hypothetical protein [Candidatus Sericytochromatia bacterium]